MLSKKLVIGLTGAALTAFTSGAAAEVRQVKRDVTPQITQEDVVLQDAGRVARMQKNLLTAQEEKAIAETKDRLAKRVEKAKEGKPVLAGIY